MSDTLLRQFAKSAAERIHKMIGDGIDPSFSAGYFQAMEDLMKWEDGARCKCPCSNCRKGLCQGNCTPIQPDHE